ncbi:MAG: aldehyde dehydrogenase [Clostridia bacterium]|nr:aldehyde dehydrogenase [Clostridia bacterium]
MERQEVINCIQMQRADHAFLDYKKRIKSLKKLYDNILLMKDEIFAALKADLNKSEIESYTTEIGMVLCEITFMIKHIKKFSRPQKVKSALFQFPAKSQILPCPYGCVLVMSPWNYPFMLSIEPMVDAIAAGNSVVLKPSRYSRNTSLAIEKLVEKTFEKNEVIVVSGGREENAFLLEQDYDYIFYTGSTAVGKIVMQKASEKFTPITLEMGGKSPCIVDDTANIPLAARRIVFGKYLNSGQTCVAPDFIYCDKSIKEQLVEELKKQITLQYTQDPISNDNYPKIINQKHFDKVKNYIDKDRVLFGGKVDDEKLKIQPTLLDSTFDDPEMNQEMFGPVLPIVTFDNLDEAIAKVNSMSTPLALYFFSQSKANQDKLKTFCRFGGGCINDTIMHIASSTLPFGGLKQSGMGQYHGKIGFDTFTHYKSVLDKKTWFDMPVRYQPYTDKHYKLIKKFMK